MTDRPYTLPQAAMLAGIEYRTLHSWAGCGMEILQVAVRAFRRWPADDTIRLALPGDVSLSLSLSEDKFTKADTP